MSAKDGRLDSATHDRIFVEEIVPRSRLNLVAAQDSPVVIITAGQPGAGKGSLVDVADIELSENAVIVDPDEVRDYHPDIGRLRQVHPYTWSIDTNADAGRWASKLRDLAIEGRRNVIIDTTLANADPVIKQIRAMQAKGYEVEIRVMATHRLESELSVDQRFTDSLKKKGYGRHVPGEFHDRAYDALPANLDKVHEQTGVRIRIYDREGRLHYDSRTSPLKPSVALEQVCQARMQDPAITRSTARQAHKQQDFHHKLPRIVQRSRVISPEAALSLPSEREAADVAPRMRRAVSAITATDLEVRIEPAAARASVGLKVACTGALLYDAYATADATAALLAHDNLAGAQSELLHFGGRNLGMAGGAALGASAGAMAGVESGPGLFATGLIGGIIGAVAGDRLVDAVDRARIHTQRGSDGHAWHFDPRHPEQQWTRSEPTGRIDPMGMPNPVTGQPAYQSHTVHADARLADELNYKASGVAVELALAHPARQQDPYVQSPGPGDAPAADTTPWTRDPATRRWSRYVSDPTMAAMGIATGTTEQANPERSAQLDRAAQATIDSNKALSPQAIADRYRSAYEAYGWSRHGQLPAAVIAAAQGQAQEPSPAARAQAATSHAEAPGPALRLDQPGHPGHELFRQAQTGMRQIDAKMGRTPDQHTDNMAASLAVSACREGLTSIDHVTWATDHNRILAVQGQLNSPFKRVMPVSLEGAKVPVQQTSQQWEQARQQHAEDQARNAAQQIAQAPSHLHMEGSRIRR